MRARKAVFSSLWPSRSRVERSTSSRAACSAVARSVTRPTIQRANRPEVSTAAMSASPPGERRGRGRPLRQDVGVPDPDEPEVAQRAAERPDHEHRHAEATRRAPAGACRAGRPPRRRRRGPPRRRAAGCRARGWAGSAAAAPGRRRCAATQAAVAPIRWPAVAGLRHQRGGDADAEDRRHHGPDPAHHEPLAGRSRDHEGLVDGLADRGARAATTEGARRKRSSPPGCNATHGGIVGAGVTDRLRRPLPSPGSAGHGPRAPPGAAGRTRGCRWAWRCRRRTLRRGTAPRRPAWRRR